jgi:hypothetical protein
MAIPSARLIILPLSRLRLWNRERLTRLLRHEIAHLEVAAFLGHVALPKWFEEGFAEWSVGGLTCEAEAMIGLDLARNRKRDGWPSISALTNRRQTPLTYYYYASFVDFLDRTDSVVSGGRLFAEIQRRGFAQALAALLTNDLSLVEVSWRAHLTSRYDATIGSATRLLAPRRTLPGVVPSPGCSAGRQ